MGLFDGLFGGSSQSDTIEYAAEKQYVIARELQDREDKLFKLWEERYRPCELALQKEVCSTPDFAPDYTALAIESQHDVDALFDRARDRTFDDLKQNCGEITCGMAREIQSAKQAARSQVYAMLSRLDEQREIVLDQRRREETYRMIALGHGNAFSTEGARLAMQVAQSQMRAAQARNASSAAGMGYALQLAQRLAGMAMAPAKGSPVQASGFLDADAAATEAYSYNSDVGDGSSAAAYDYSNVVDTSVTTGTGAGDFIDYGEVL